MDRAFENINILVIEYDPYSLTLQEDLESGGFKVVLIDDPRKIETHMARMTFDLVLTDVFWVNPETAKEDLPRIQEIIKAVREKDSLVPIILLSDKANTHEEALRFEGEIYDIWSKTSGYPQFHIYRVKNVLRRR